MSSIAEVNAGQWVRCAALGWPLDRLGPDAEVWIDPLPSAAYQHAMTQVSLDVGGPRETPRYYARVEKELPRVYAAAVMTRMRGIRLTPEADVLPDNQANRRAVLLACPLLTERVYRFATQGPAGIENIEWRAIAMQHLGAVREALAILLDPALPAFERVIAARPVLEAVELVPT